MKAVVYFNAPDIDAARAKMGHLKAEGVKVHWAGAEEFQDPRDVELLDEVFLISDAPHVEAAYEKRGVKVNKPKPKREDKKPESLKTIFAKPDIEPSEKGAE